MVKRDDVSQDTVELLKECDAGCKMAIDSMEQIGKYVDDKKLKDIIMKYNEAHIQLEDTSHRILNAAGAEGGEPGIWAKTFASLQAKVKLMMKDDVHQAASLLTDGCNMGIKSLHEYKNKYKAADEQSVGLCDQLCDLETKMVNELQPLL